MTTWLDFRSEPVAQVPEIEEYVSSVGGWSLTCTAPDCNWVDYATEFTADWIEEMQEAIARHKQWHEDGMPE